MNDLLVIELASVLAGPSVGQFFAELGARVIKVENPAVGGDVTRSWRLTGESATGISSYFASCNFGKESIALALDTDADRATLHRLVAHADIVITSFAPGQAERLGADGPTLMALNPRLVHAAVTGYGFDDHRAGYDAVLQAETGFMHMNGSPDGPPTKMPVALIDLLAAHQLKEAILVALWKRERSGSGDSIHVSLRDAAVSSLANQASNWLNAGHDPRRLGSEHPNIAPYGAVHTTRDDRMLVLAVGTDGQFRALAGLLGRADWIDDPRFADNPSRVRHREPLNHLLADAIGEWRLDDLLARLAEARIPAGAIRPLSEVFAEEAVARCVLSSEGAHGIRQVAFDSRSAGPRRDLAPPPALDQHGTSIRRELDV